LPEVTVRVESPLTVRVKPGVGGMMTGWVPVPESGTESGVVEAEVARRRDPPCIPAEVGVKVTWRVQEACEARELPVVGQSPVSV